MKIYIERTKEEKELSFEGKAVDLIKKLGLNTEEVLIIKNNDLITEDEELKNSDIIKLLSVVSGG